MDNMKYTRGFITIATGKEEYFQLAQNLLRSYRYFCENPLPFAILTDKENEYTKDFDDLLIIQSGATNSYLDKLSLGDYLPYDETIFIDADCLAYGNLNKLFNYFEDSDDFSCFGRVLALDDKTGWFEYENLGELKQKVTYCVGLHGGIYYMRKGDNCRRVFELAKSFVHDYEKYRFKGNFSTPGDEPLIALAMAVNDCKPVPFSREAICCYWEYVKNIKIDITKSLAKTLSEPQVRTILIHWGTRYTRELMYQQQVNLLKLMEKKASSFEIINCKTKFRIRAFIGRNFYLVLKIKNKILRMFKIG